MCSWDSILIIHPLRLYSNTDACSCFVFSAQVAAAVARVPMIAVQVARITTIHPLAALLRVRQTHMLSQRPSQTRALHALPFVWADAQVPTHSLSHTYTVYSHSHTHTHSHTVYTLTHTLVRTYPSQDPQHLSACRAHLPALAQHQTVCLRVNAMSWLSTADARARLPRHMLTL